MDSNHSPFIKSLLTRVGTDSHRDIETVNLYPSTLMLCYGLVVSMLASCSLNSVEIELGGREFKPRRF